MTAPSVFDLVNDPTPVSQEPGDVFDLVNAKRPSLPARVGSAVKEMVTHPWETAKGMVTAPLHAAKTGAEFIGQTAAELSLSDDLRARALEDPERISERDALLSAAQLATLGPGGRLLGMIPKVGLPLAGAAAGAAFSPDDPAVGAILGTAGGAIAKVAPEAFRSFRERSPAPQITVRKTPRIPAERAAERLAQAVKPQPIDAPVSTAASRDLAARLEGILEPNRVKPGTSAPISPDVFPEGFTTDPRVTRIPAANAEARLAAASKPLPDETPVSTAATRDRIAELDRILEPNRVKPGEPLPPTTETFPEGYSTTGKVRRPGGTPPSGDVFDLVNEESPVTATAVVEPPAAPKVAESIPVIGEPVSVGRDLAEPGRIPADAPKVRAPRGVDPRGTVATREGAISVGKDLPFTEKAVLAAESVPEPPPAPTRPTRRVTAETMLQVGKQRAAELEAGIPPGASPDIAPALKRTGQPLADPSVPPSPEKAPADYINYAKFGLDRTTEARLRDTVEGLRRTGDVGKGYQSFAEQQARADALAKEFVQNPLDIDRAKLAKLSGAEIVGLRTVAAENTRLVEGLSKSMESGELTAAELAEANRLLDHAVQSTNDVLGAIVRETAQKGRDLGFLRQVAKLTTDPDVWVVRAKKMLGDKPLSDTMMVEIRKLAREAAEACA